VRARAEPAPDGRVRLELAELGRLDLALSAQRCNDRRPVKVERLGRAVEQRRRRGRGCALRAGRCRRGRERAVRREQEARRGRQQWLGVVCSNGMPAADRAGERARGQSKERADARRRRRASRIMSSIGVLPTPGPPRRARAGS
jgi:hypothetical protein